MGSLFNPEDNARIIRRIESLSQNNIPLWGKMNVVQMLAHCAVPIRVGFGEVRLQRSLTGYLFGSIARKKLLRDPEFPKNLPTDKNFLVSDLSTIDMEKERLVTLVKRFAEKGRDAIASEPHPFFGDLKPEEWDLLSWKHLDHHLRQFGV